MLDQVREVTSGTLDVLELLAVLCGLALFTFAVASLALATFRVAVRGRVLVLPFGGNDERRIELTNLFIRRLTTMEQDWVRMAKDIDATKAHVNRSQGDRPHRASSAPVQTPLVEGDALPPLPGPEIVTAGAAPRTSGDELFKEIFQLGGVGSIGNADLGVISLAGVSFSPRDILALLRAAPAVCARRLLRGAVVVVAGGHLVSVEYEERGLRHSRRRAEVLEVQDDKWLPAIEQLAFALAKQRVYLLRERQQRFRRRVAPRSKTLEHGLIEADSWISCELFMRGYAAHLIHYRDGRASDREDALALYEEALAHQPQYPRAAYNRATLLYNRYLPHANDVAIEGFTLATTSRDGDLRALAFAGAAIAHCQAIQRFKRNFDDHSEQARVSAQQAIELRPGLEEAVFANAWIEQIDGRWEHATRTYERVAALRGQSAPARRIKSFALNNAGWIWLDPLRDRPDALKKAEVLLWSALAYYPNKVAYANLAQIARRCGHLNEALELQAAALALDGSYANVLNERAIVHIELANKSIADNLPEQAATHTREAKADAVAAQQLAAEDPWFANKLAEDYAEAVMADPSGAARAAGL